MANGTLAVMTQVVDSVDNGFDMILYHPNGNLTETIEICPTGIEIARKLNSVFSRSVSLYDKRQLLDANC